MLRVQGAWEKLKGVNCSEQSQSVISKNFIKLLACLIVMCCFYT